jgi:hypothetical protein
MVGCGNSKLSEEMYEDGYTDILNIDISDVVIEKMKEHYQEKCPLMQWEVGKHIFYNKKLGHLSDMFLNLLNICLNRRCYQYDI